MSSSSVTNTKTNGINLFSGVSQGPNTTKESSALAEVSTAGLDEPCFPSRKRLPARLDPGEYLIDLLSVGVYELQAPEIEFLEMAFLECQRVGRSVRWNVQSIPWPGATISQSSKRLQEVGQEYHALRLLHSLSSLIRRYRVGERGH